MIRPVTTEDQDTIIAIAEASGLFRPEEVEAVAGMLAAHLGGQQGSDHVWLTDDDDGPTAVAYYAPEPFADGVWNLYLLAVHPDRQGDGRGAALVRHVEADVRTRGARVLLIETSGLPRFERTRAFYLRCGYVQEARIRDYYGEGDDKIVFWKSVGGGPDSTADPR
jgi:GNAT superfamily N-acetyltransferase